MKKITLFLVSLVFAGALWAQNVQVSGVVSDTEGQVLPGVSVVVKGTRTTVTSDVNGRYTISVPSDAVLVFSFTGMGTQEIPVDGRTSIDVSMAEDAVQLRDVVVIGYGSGQKLGTQIGTISQVKAEKLENRPVANVADALQGKVAGLQVYTSSGEPGAVSSMRLHGVGSLGSSNEPLLLLDGMPVGTGTIMGMNPNDFESITVLKDASATSIYGSRGANGVIVYTTKRGVTKKDAEVTARAQYGVSQLASTHFYDRLMNTEQLTDYYVATGYRTQKEVDQILKNLPNDTRWGDWFFSNSAPVYQADVSIRGGGEKNTYFISGSMFDQEGLVPNSYYGRYTLRSNVDSRINDWLRVGLNIGGYYDISRSNPNMGSNYLSGGLLYMLLPYYTPLNPDGSDKDYISEMGLWNPKYMGRDDVTKQRSKTAEAVASGYIEITPIENLTIKSQAGIDAGGGRYSSLAFPSKAGRNGSGSVREDYSLTTRAIITNTAEYKFDLFDDHHFTLLAGQEGIQYHYDFNTVTTTGQSDDRLMLLQHGSTTQRVNTLADVTYFSEYAYLSYFGRLDYDYLDKYFVDFSVRNDQSSRFGKDNRSAMFYSGGVMWDIKKEDFLATVDWLNALTFRASVGTSGNSEIGNYAHLATVATYGSPYNGSVGWGISGAGNSSLTWEKQMLTTIGVKADLLEDRLHVDVSYYNRQTSSMLMDVPYPYTSGFATIGGNVGKMQNQGVDISLEVNAWRSSDGDAYIDFSTVFNYNANKILELFQGLDRWTVPNTGVTFVVGQPVSYYYPLRAGIDPADGKQMWYVPGEDNTVTTKGETTKTFNSTLLQNTGVQRFPPVSGGFSLSGGWKGFALNADFSYVLGKYLINNDSYFTENPSVFLGQINQREDILDYWREPGDVTVFPAIGEQLQFDDHLIESASFLRLKALTLSYTFPASMLRSTNVFKGVKIYATGRNLITLTKFRGTDPEIDSNLTLGAYPNTRQFSIGVDLTF